MFLFGKSIWPSSASKVLNNFLLICQSHNSLFFFRRPPLLLTLFTFIGYGRTTPGVTFFPKYLPTCANDGFVKPNDQAVRTEGSLQPPHKTDDDLKPSSLKPFPVNGHPCQSILHDKWNCMCRGDYTFEVKNTSPTPSNIGHPTVILCNTKICLKMPHASNFNLL